MEEICDNAIYLPTVTNGVAYTWFHSASTTANIAYLKRIGDYAISLPGIPGYLNMYGGCNDYVGVFRNLFRLTSVGTCFMYAPNATAINLGSCFYGINAILASGVFSSFDNNFLYPGLLGADPTVSAGCFQSFDDSEIHFGDLSAKDKNKAPVFQEYTKNLPVDTFVSRDRSKMYFGWSMQQNMLLFIIIQVFYQQVFFQHMIVLL
ncbi:MAG: hypothetical protein LBD41_02250 [Clostridiales Family XIII bacterium]|nr:hypothetical protein [Clostridiales Family XIII bacterium]